MIHIFSTSVQKANVKQINILWSIFISIWYLADKENLHWFHLIPPVPWPACRRHHFLSRNHFWWLPDLISSSGEWVLFELLEWELYPGWINQSKKGLTGQRSSRAPLLALSLKMTLRVTFWVKVILSLHLVAYITHSKGHKSPDSLLCLESDYCLSGSTEPSRPASLRNLGQNSSSNTTQALQSQYLTLWKYFECILMVVHKLCITTWRKKKLFCSSFDSGFS